MSKMKHLLRKLHIGNDNNNHHGHHRRIPNPNRTTTTTTTTVTTSPSSPTSSTTVNDSTPPPSTSPSTTVSSPPSVDSTDRSASAESVSTNVAVDNNSSVNNSRSGGRGDYSYFEEEFQVQLAMAISASADREARTRDRVEDESDCQIKAAKQLSLACSPAVPDNDRLSEYLSLKYWNYNVVQYDEKVVDGFYDVYAIASNPVPQGAMPLLVDLQAISVLDSVEYEVLLVHRSVDVQLQQLENKVYAMSVECRVLGNGLYLNGLIQRLAEVVVDKMGGPVGDAGEMMKRWRLRTSQLRASLNSVVLPLGCLDVGLSRHRALLFKVLADRIHLPCMLVKGSLYTGTDEGAVNLVKFEDGSEYIIDLMGAPGTLIPSEIPSSLILNTALEARGFSDSSAAVNNLSMVFDQVVGLEGVIPDILRVGNAYGSVFKESAPIVISALQGKEIDTVSEQAKACDNPLEKSAESEPDLYDFSQSAVEEASLAQEKKVKDVSKYVISAAKNPEFAQKLHAVLLESGASPPADLFVNMNPDIRGKETLLELVQPLGQEFLYSGASYNSGDYRSNYDTSLLSQSTFLPLNNLNNKQEQILVKSIGKQLEMDSDCVSPPQRNSNDGIFVTEAAKMISNDTTVDSSCRGGSHDGCMFQGSGGKTINQTEVGEDLSLMVMESGSGKRGFLASCNGHSESPSPSSGENICPVLGEFAEWEIPWEDLHVGERIGIGSFGEVYRADWNGTEVAVKKFLVQDLTGDVLVQFKSEAEMMIRLRHPNVVLFMGAVTRPPNLSILTEFLPRGSLYRLLHRSGTQIDEKKRMKMALDVARGMNYLHTCHPTVVHRDLKSPNLLVDKNWVVKVCDFGLSRLKHHTFLSSNSTAGTPEWMAPEVLRNEPSNEKCDVYSFGVILWELATLCIPWTGLNPMQVVGAVGFQNRRLQIPEDIDPIVAKIIQDCWENDPRSRPSFSQLIPRLKGLHHLVVQRNTN